MPLLQTVTLACALGALSVTAHATPPPGGSDDVVSTFDTGNDGWIVIGDAQGGSATPDWHATGGNPGGYVSADDDVLGGTWYWSAPPAFLGDRSGAYGNALRFELRQSNTSSPFENREFILRGAGLELYYDFDFSMHPGTDWTPYAIPLTAGGGWLVDGTGVAPTEAEFLSVLGDLEELLIRGEYRSGADTGSLDNVVLEGGAGCLQALTATLDDDTPAPGQTLTFSVTVVNDDTRPAPLDLWLDATGPVNQRIRLGSGTLPAGATVTRSVRLHVPSNAPSGVYALDLNVGDFASGDVCDTVSFMVTVGGEASGDDDHVRRRRARRRPAGGVRRARPGGGRARRRVAGGGPARRDVRRAWPRGRRLRLPSLRGGAGHGGAPHAHAVAPPKGPWGAVG
jgi:hypothetical protein